MGESLKTQMGGMGGNSKGERNIVRLKGGSQRELKNENQKKRGKMKNTHWGNGRMGKNSRAQKHVKNANWH